MKNILQISFAEKVKDVECEKESKPIQVSGQTTKALMKINECFLVVQLV